MATLILDSLFALARRVVPALIGRQAPCITNAADIDRGVRALAESVQARHPEAGRAYWSMRCWGLLVWQPIYFSVIAAELADGWVPLTGFAPDIEDGEVTGFSIAADGLSTSDRRTRRCRAAAQVHAVCEPLFDSLQRVLPMHRKAARRVQANCALAALLRIQARTELVDNAALRAAGQAWLHELGWIHESGYLGFASCAGVEHLALDRRVCCLDFRRRGGEMCSTCPRLTRDERMARLCAEHRPHERPVPDLSWSPA